MNAELEQVLAECGHENWDGDEAEPVSKESVSFADKFLAALPADIKQPDLGADPDGMVSLDWTPERKRRIAMSIAPTGSLIYAWLDGAEKESGVLPFDGKEIPEKLIQIIRKILII